MSNDSSEYEAALLGLLGDEYIQGILAATSRSPMSAKELSDELDADVSTIYRRVDDMLDHDLLVERTRIVEDGSHHSVYEAKVDHVDVDIEDGDLVVEMEVRESPSERFTRIWDDIRET
ncbi:MAG: ArsR/SmtB family transcription factor [Haloplanus sp.]